MCPKWGHNLITGRAAFILFWNVSPVILHPSSSQQQQEYPNATYQQNITDDFNRAYVTFKLEYSFNSAWFIDILIYSS